MRLIVQPNYDLLSEWAANYVAKRINEFAPKEAVKDCSEPVLNLDCISVHILGVILLVLQEVTTG